MEKSEGGADKLVIDDALRSLCGEDTKLYLALSNFLLLDPKHQEKQIGSANQLLEKGTKALAGGDRLQARVIFEIAARMALYQKDRASVEKALKLAEQASEEEDEARHEMHEALLTNLDRAFNIANRYYGPIYASSIDEEKKEGKALDASSITVVAK